MLKLGKSAALFGVFYRALCVSALLCSRNTGAVVCGLQIRGARGYLSWVCAGPIGKKASLWVKLEQNLSNGSRHPYWEDWRGILVEML